MDNASITVTIIIFIITCSCWKISILLYFWKSTMLITHFKRLLVMMPIMFLASCATETSTTVAPKQVTSAATPYSWPKNPISVGKFDNRSTFLRGLFSDGVDRLTPQRYQLRRWTHTVWITLYPRRAKLDRQTYPNCGLPHPCLHAWGSWSVCESRAGAAYGSTRASDVSVTI